MSSLLAVEELRVSFRTERGIVRAVDGISFGLGRGEVLAVVGESGSGKSAAALSLIGLTRGPNAEVSGRARIDGLDLIAADGEQLRRVRGREIGFVFQDPMSSLNPVLRIGEQIAEGIRAHRSISDREAAERSIELLRSVQIPAAEQRARAYPHELSGGLRQRALIAMALCNDPSVLIADEPTTALDVTTQAQILGLLGRLREERGLAVILITHDLGVVAEIAHRTLVMYGGRIVESGTVEQIFDDPQHPYTWGLLGSVPRADRPRAGRLAQIAGQPPSLLAPPAGCHFRPRCPHAFDRCSEVPPLAARAGDEHLDRCWLAPERKRSLRIAEGGEVGLRPEGPTR